MPTAGQVIGIIQAVNSPWFGSILDVGSLRRSPGLLRDRHGYRGYLPIPTLGEGDPARKVMKLANEMRRVFAV